MATEKGVMSFIIKMITEVLGVKWLLATAWSLAYPVLKKITESNNAEWDDKSLELINQIIKKICDSKAW